MPANNVHNVSFASAIKVYDCGDTAIYEGSASEFMANTGTAKTEIGSQASELRDKIMIEAGNRLTSLIS